MKGVIFVEFLEMVESYYGNEVVDRIVAVTNAKPDRVYCVHDSYSPDEIICLIEAVSSEVDILASDLMKLFGEHLFRRFVILYSSSFALRSDVFDVLENLEHDLQSKSPSLDPEWELPDFKTHRVSSEILQVSLHSRIKTPEVALGLLRGCQKYFHEELEVEIKSNNSDSSEVILILSRN